MSDKEIEQEIQAKGLTAPRVTPQAIEDEIASEHYFTAADALSGGDIKKAAGRFLGWRLPDDFYPDAGVTFTRPDRDIDWPVGTNLLTQTQAEKMLEHALDAKSCHPSLNLLTFCVLVMRNGFTVTGESACASPENFDSELGRKIARQNAIAKLYPLMGYELRSKLAANQ